MKHERTSTSRSIMQTDRLAIELNSSADPSKSTPHGDEGRFWGQEDQFPPRGASDCCGFEPRATTK
jgi:hypothetical protein